MRMLLPSLFAILLPGVPAALAGAADGDAAALLEKTGTKGGLCLAVGAKDTALARALAAKSALFVQTLQPDAKLAAAWGAEFARQDCLEREKLGVRNAAFDADHYGSNVFNLVVVEDAAALGGAKLADLCRMLVPGGCVVLRKAPDSFAAEAKGLGMTGASVGGYSSMLRKPVKPVEWKSPLETKWLAGPRSQIANGFKGTCTGGGKLFYIEQKERDGGDLGNSAAVVFARDAHNGRTLWSHELPGSYVRNDRIDLTANSRGRVFAKASTGQVVCLDGDTGKVLLEVPGKANEFARLSMLNDDLLCISGDVRSSADGKPLWKFPSVRYQPLPGTIIGDRIFFCDGTNIFAKKVATGEELWKKPVSELSGGAGTGALSAIDGRLLVRMAGTREEAPYALLDPANGKLTWTYTMKVPVDPKERYFDARNVRVTHSDGKLLLYYRHNQQGVYPDEVVGTRLDMASGKPEFENKVNKDAGDFHGCFGELQLGDYIAWYDLWVNRKTLETSKTHSPHPACFFGSNSAYGMIFNFPSRKSGPISAVGPVDAPVKAAASPGTLTRLGSAPSARDTGPQDWPCFRGNAAGGNSLAVDPGKDLVKAWEARVSLGASSFGLMSSERTGLSQAVVAYGLAVVADIDGGRIVALDAATGKEKWVHHVGSRVDYPPTLYKGLCLFAARDGFVRCLDAATGKPVYALRVAPQERYIGSREKLESRWALSSDVTISGGTAWVACEGGGMNFTPETGAAVQQGKPASGGRDLQLSYDMLLKGNSIPRTNEDNKHGFTRTKFGRNLDARVMAFDDQLTVAYHFRPAGEGWANKGQLFITAVAGDVKKPVWSTEPVQLVVSDIVLTRNFAYCVGHYQRIKKPPELWVLSREDGKVVGTVPVDGFPAFFGMSAAGDRLFVATRDGRLICYRGK